MNLFKRKKPTTSKAEAKDLMQRLSVLMRAGKTGTATVSGRCSECGSYHYDPLIRYSEDDIAGFRCLFCDTIRPLT